MLPSSITTSSNRISPKTLCSLSLYLMMLYIKWLHLVNWHKSHTSLKCEWTTTNGQTDGLGMPNYCNANTSLWAFGSGDLKRKLRRHGEPNPPIFLCLKQSRSYQNDLAYIQNVKKTAQVIFCFLSFDTNWKFQNSLTFPWHFRKHSFFPDTT